MKKNERNVGRKKIKDGVRVIITSDDKQSF